jgi:hypothetical protein
MITSTLLTKSRFRLHSHAFNTSGFMSITNPLQHIYDYLEGISNIDQVTISPQSEPNLTQAITAMNSVTLEHLNLNTRIVSSLKYPISLNIASNECFDITAFALPKHYHMTLHDHPTMTVCSKLLHGKVRVRSYSSLSTNNGEIIANKELDCEKLSNDDAWLLSATTGNYHEITVLEDCVMLDLLLPPYDDKQRCCTFYEATPFSPTDHGEFRVVPLSPVQQGKVKLPYAVPYKGFVPRSWTRR